VTVRELNTMVRDGEGLTLEFKRADIKPSDLAETFAAMANTRGGIVLIGVSDSGTFVGVPSLTAARDLVSIAARECVTPPARVRTSEVRLNSGGVVLVVRVSRSKDPVATVSGRFMLREASRNVPATLGDIARLLSVRSKAEAYPYEILEHEFMLTLSDASGARANLSRRARVRFLRDRTFSIRDRIWGDGKVSPIRDVEPGLVVDQFEQGNQLNSLISLREPRRRGELETVRVKHDMVDCFRADHEWFEVDVDVPTHLVRVEIRFPPTRIPRAAWLIELPAGDRSTLRGANLNRVPASAAIVWRRRKPQPGTRLRTEWDW
jgi:Putative DNA-binding domain